MDTLLINTWTDKKANDTSDQAAQNPTDEIAQIGIDGGPDNDATNLDEPAKDRWWLYREAARFGLSFDLCL